MHATHPSIRPERKSQTESPKPNAGAVMKIMMGELGTAATAAPNHGAKWSHKL